MNGKHIVIDIETLGTLETLIDQGSCIVLEAAFIVIDKLQITHQFTAAFNIKNQQDHGIKGFSKDTVNWWHKPEMSSKYVALKKACDEATEQNVHMFCSELRQHCQQARYWSLGKDFDYPILGAFLRKYHHQAPWLSGFKFKRTHCIRDFIFFSEFKKKSVPNADAHRALPDAIHEATILIEILKNKG